MAKKRKERRTKGTYLTHLLCDYMYTYERLFGSFEETRDNPLNLLIGQSSRQITVPTGIKRRFITALYELISYTDEKLEKSGRKLWDGVRYHEPLMTKRVIRSRKRREYYLLFEYINRKWGVRISDPVLAVLSDKLNVPFYLLRESRKSWRETYHKKFNDETGDSYLDDESLVLALPASYRVVVNEVFKGQRKSFMFNDSGRGRKVVVEL